MNSPAKDQKVISKKIVQFTIIAESSTYVIYNLAFGDVNVDSGELDDLSVTNNGDTEKILATVAVAVNLFLNQHPDIGIYATGSTIARNRLYRMAISKYFERSESDIMILGQAENDDWLTFEKSINYKAFFVYKKEVSLDNERNN